MNFFDDLRVKKATRGLVVFQSTTNNDADSASLDLIIT